MDCHREKNSQLGDCREEVCNWSLEAYMWGDKLIRSLLWVPNNIPLVRNMGAPTSRKHASALRTEIAAEVDLLSKQRKRTTYCRCKKGGY